MQMEPRLISGLQASVSAPEDFWAAGWDGEVVISLRNAEDLFAVLSAL